VGFIGFGEAGFHLAKGLAGAGISGICAFDVESESPDQTNVFQDRAARSRTTLLKSRQELARGSDILFSAVTAGSAVDAARENAPFLTSEHVFVDINSVSPEAKQSIEQIVTSTGATFVEAAVMAPVPPYAHRVPMLLAGTGSFLLVQALGPFGMQFEILSGPTGAAAAVKMCRSIVVKGLEALLFECVLAASRFGATERVFASLSESFPGLDWKKMADYTIGRVVVHGERRAREMDEVAATLRAVHIEPMMAEAAARRQDWSARMGLRSHFGPEGPAGFAQVVELISRIERGPEK
jgi:3-hydroxyisobutyrate dehydrogenase-like beta-hydroxyacid dehydrogenase